MKMKFPFLMLALGLFNILSGQVTLSSNIPSILPAGTNTVVDVRVSKGSIANFAKYQLDVPAGITVMEVDSKAGNFTFENNRAKIVWVSVPSEAEFMLQFRIKVTATTPTEGAIVQKFYYLDNGAKKEVEGVPMNIAFGGSANTKNLSGSVVQSTQPVASNTTKTETVKSEPVKSEPAKTEPVKSTPVKTEPVKSEPVKTETVKSEPVTESPSGGLIYKVQLASSPSDPGKSKYASLGSNIKISKEDGAYKVVYGSYNTKEEALKAKDELAAKGFNGFLVKYQNGVRVK